MGSGTNPGAAPALDDDGAPTVGGVVVVVVIERAASPTNVVHAVPRSIADANSAVMRRPGTGRW
jgi:hypothetical protein